MVETTIEKRSACHNSSVSPEGEGYKCDVCGHPCELVDAEVQAPVAEEGQESAPAESAPETETAPAPAPEEGTGEEAPVEGEPAPGDAPATEPAPAEEGEGSDTPEA